MRNILSYQRGSIFTGEEINNWIEFYLTIPTSSHYHDAVKLLNYTFIDNRKYMLCWFPRRDRGIDEPRFVRKD